MSNEYKPFATVSEMAAAYDNLRYRVSKTFESIFDRAQELAVSIKADYGDDEYNAFAAHMRGQAYRLAVRIERYRESLHDNLSNYSKVDSERESFIKELDTIEKFVDRLNAAVEEKETV